MLTSICRIYNIDIESQKQMFVNVILAEMNVSDVIQT